MWDATLYAYDVSGKVIASDRILNPGQTFQYQTLSLSSKEAIAGFAVLPDNPLHPQSGQYGADHDAGAGTSSWALLGAGLMLLAGARAASNGTDPNEGQVPCNLEPARLCHTRRVSFLPRS
jgi:hypothetical protein